MARNAKVTYLITVGNDATDPVTGVKVRDFLPAGSHYIEATGTNQLPLHADLELSWTARAARSRPAHGHHHAERVRAGHPRHLHEPGDRRPRQHDPGGQRVRQPGLRRRPSWINGGNGAFNELLEIFMTASDRGHDARRSDQLHPQGVGTPGRTRPRTSRFVIVAVGRTSSPPTEAGPGTGRPVHVQPGGWSRQLHRRDDQGQRRRRAGPDVNITGTAPNQQITLHNQAVVDPDNTIPEGSEMNNSAAWPDMVDTPVNLTITKRGPYVGQSQTSDYEIVVTNEMKAGRGAGGRRADARSSAGRSDPVAVEIDPGRDNWACQIQGRSDQRR